MMTNHDCILWSLTILDIISTNIYVRENGQENIDIYIDKTNRKMNWCGIYLVL